MKLRWHPLASVDRTAIFEHIVQQDPRAAVRLDERIEARIESLRRFPQSGRAGRITGTRELPIQGTPYIVAYMVEDDAIRLCVCCTARDSGLANCRRTRSQ